MNTLRIMGARFLTEEESYKYEKREASRNPIEWTLYIYMCVCVCVCMCVCVCVISCISFLRGSRSSKTPVARSTFYSHVLVSKCNSPLMGTKALWRNGLFQRRGRESIRRAQNSLLCQKVRKNFLTYQKMGHIKRHRNQFEEAPTGQIWDILGMKINNDSSR